LCFNFKYFVNGCRTGIRLGNTLYGLRKKQVSFLIVFYISYKSGIKFVLK